LLTFCSKKQKKLNRDIEGEELSEDEESSVSDSSESDANENEDFPDFGPDGYHPCHIG